jgi:hypothetical protein
MAGDGNMADVIHQLFRTAKRKHMAGRQMPPHDLTKFLKRGNFSLF